MWSVQARWALDHHIIRYRYTEHIPMITTPLLRLAALRWLIYWAPLDVTKGAPYLAKRRLVRLHYGV